MKYPVRLAPSVTVTCLAAFIALMSACGGGSTLPGGGSPIPGGPTVTSASAATAGTESQFYRFWLTASGGQSPYTWSVGAGVPPGLAINGSALEGTPTTAGVYNFTATVTDALAATAVKAMTLTINPVGTPSAPVITSTSPFTSGTESTAYTFTPTVSGGTAPLTWSISARALPAGLNLNTATGAITGTPTLAGTYNFTMMVTDSLSASGTLPATLVIASNGSPAPLDARVETGINYLLANQNAAGDFDIGYQPSADPYNGARVAVTALVCMSLLDYIDVVSNPTTVKNVIDLGIDYVKQNVFRQVQQPINDFKFTSWGQMYSVVFLSRLIARPEWAARVSEFQSERTDIRSYMGNRAGQSSVTTPPYYITWGYGNAFHTPAMYIALEEIQQAGEPISATVLPYTAAGLEMLKIAGGQEAYMYSLTAATIPDGAYRYQDACARIGACALASYKAGNTTQAELESTIDLFVLHKDWMNQQRVRTDTLISGPLPYRFNDSTPYCWFYHFGYYYTALALKSVSKAKAQAIGPQLETDLYAARGTDGLWKAFELPASANVAPGNRLYSTAMSIMALKCIEDAMK